MRVHLHTLCWNERRMLEFFFRHFEPWVDRFFIFDDGSSDGSLEYLQSRADVVVARTERSDPDSWVRSAQHIYDNDWKRSIGEADWVVVTNIDEHVHRPEMRAYLSRLRDEGVTAVPALGYQMIAEAFPPPDSLLCRDLPMGAPWRQMSKLAIFRPDRIRETRFSPGRHQARPEGEVVYPERDEVANLHYKYLGVGETHARHAALDERLGPTDRASGWGHKYGWTLADLDRDFAAMRAALVDTTRVDHHATHREPRWWRKGC